jgi:hypothetical protein
LKKAKKRSGRTYGRGNESVVLEYTVTFKDNHGAIKSEETLKVTVKGTSEFDLEKNKDEFREKIEVEYAKKKNTELREELVAL